ncbi:hypothetical protein F4561_003715 [Lipingzhangella halophila]|uniref:Uncharacterized protein n=1 Tax=Lipingzhangella halophila TaxID=1783352 RepID=A0A7W7W4M9_9ACTN|nr:hypothetical protein [Lipingzhangella halophila]MBB4932895.1 hypothetical protein [Lipingzhangella halophila]
MTPGGNQSMLRGDGVVRVHWVLGTDLLRAVCHCGAERLFEDPVELWAWVLAHPDGHGGGTGPGASPGDEEPAVPRKPAPALG